MASTGFQFLKIAPDARSAAMGGAVTAGVDDDATGVRPVVGDLDTAIPELAAAQRAVRAMADEPPPPATPAGR